MPLKGSHYVLFQIISAAIPGSYILHLGLQEPHVSTKSISVVIGVTLGVILPVPCVGIAVVVLVRGDYTQQPRAATQTLILHVVKV